MTVFEKDFGKKGMSEIEPRFLRCPTLRVDTRVAPLRTSPSTFTVTAFFFRVFFFSVAPGYCTDVRIGLVRYEELYNGAY